MSINTIEIPEDLREAINANRCAVLVGAGASQSSGFPGWASLLSDLIEFGEKENYLRAEEASSLKEALKDASAYLDIAQHLSDRFGEQDLLSQLFRIFTDDSRKPSDLHRAIIETRFKFIVTTNYDRMLEDAYAEKNHKTPTMFTHRNADDFADAMWDSKYFILKAHGDIQQRNTIILTRRDYREVIHSSPGYRHLLASIFTNNLILFVGASLVDPEVNLLLSNLHSAFHGSGKNHYALIEDSGIHDFMVERWRKDYKVRVIKYTKSDDTHPEVLDFIRRLSKI